MINADDIRSQVSLSTDEAEAFLDYWCSLPRPVNGVPSQRDFDPTAIPALLPNILLHDLTAPGCSILRIVGTNLVDRFGFDATGRDYGEFVKPERRAVAISALQTVAHHPCGMHVHAQWQYHRGELRRTEGLGFPLVRRDGEGRLMMFLDVSIESIGYDDVKARDIIALGVSGRKMINIGFGVPDWSGDPPESD